MANPTITVNVGSINISSSAFAELLRVQLDAAGIPINTTATINLVINIGAGVQTIAPGAFASASALPANIFTSTASIVFAARTTEPLSIGADAFANLPLQTLTLPAPTTLQPNALTNLTHLTTLNASALTTPLATNSLNLTRPASAATNLVLLMPTTAVSYSNNTVVLPPATSTTNTVVFNGSVPSTTQLQTLFTAPANTAAPVQIAINYETTSGVSAEQITALRTALTTSAAPQAVSYTSVVAVIAATSPTATTLGTLTGVSQFAGDYFNYLQINSTECVLTGLTTNAISNNVTTIPVPAVVTPKDTTSNLNVVAVASRLSLGTSTSNVFYIFDNYYDETVSSVPLVALVGKTADNAFTPAIVCNGVINVSEIDGTITISGATTTVNGVPAYCMGYTSGAGSGNGGATPVSLLTATNNTPLYNKGNSSSIGSISISTTSNTFTITLHAIKETSLTQTLLTGAFQSNTAITTVDFTNIAHAGQMAWSSFSAAVGAVISNNNSLNALISAVVSYQLPTGYTPPALPTIANTNNTIVAELSALNSSNTNVLSKWNAVKAKYALYSNYFGLSDTAVNSANGTSIYKYVSDVAAALNAGVSANPNWVNDAAFFSQAKTSLATYVPALNAALNSTNGTLLPIVAAYQSSRFQIGNQTFYLCSSMLSVVGFELLQSLVKVNAATFYGCSSIQTSMAIPKNVETIHFRAFWVCSAMSGLNLQNALALRIIEKEAFRSCNGLRGSLSFSSSTYAPNSVETIGDYAFAGCSGLTDHLYLPPGLKSLGVGAFQDCSGLNGTIVLPSNGDFTVIPDFAFSRCSNLTGISNNTGNNTSLQYLPISGSTNNIPNGLLIPSSVLSIGAGAFLGCTKFAGALNLQTGRNIQQIKEEAFKNCVGFTSLLLPNVAQYNTIASNCFNGCTGLTSVVFPTAVTTIMDGAFRGCTNIAGKLNLDNVQNILANAFNGCSSLSGALILGAYLYSLGDNAFFNCPQINSVTFLGPPTTNITNIGLIFGLTVASTVKLYINVFVENGWTAYLGTTGTIRISSVFRNGGTSGSPVQTSLIDFKIPTPTTNVMDLTINQFQGFTVLTNGGTSGDNLAIQTAAADAKQWIDVCLPGVLKGYDATTADKNAAINPSMISSLAKLYASIDDQQTESYTALQAALNVSSAVKGTNISIEAGIAQTGITVKEITLPYTVAVGDVLPFYGVVNASGVNKLYYAATNGFVIPADATALVTTVGANVQFYVQAATGTNATQYLNKIIQVNSTGVISISRITVLGYANTPDVKVNTYDSSSTTLPISSTTGYSIVNSSNTPSLNIPQLYFNDVLAVSRAYYIPSGGAGVGTGLSDWTSKVFYVNQQGIIYQPANQQTLIYVAAANETTQFNVASVAGYAIVNSAPANPGNTTYTLYFGNGTVSSPAVAGSYYIKSSNLAIFNETIITVSTTGGISIGSVGLIGASNTFTDITNQLSSLSIPIYNTNQKSLNVDYFVNKYDLPIAMTNFNKYNAALLGSFKTLTAANNNLNTVVAQYSKSLPADFITANTATNVKVNAFIASPLLDDANGIFMTAMSSIVQSQSALTTIQTNTLGTINDFITKSSYTAAATASVSSGTTPPTPVAFVQAQIEYYAIKYLTYQYVNKPVSFISTTVENVNNGLNYTTALSRLNKNMADYAATIINAWFVSSTGGNSSWNTLELANSTQILTWFNSHVVAFTATALGLTGTATIYSKYLDNRPIPTLVQVAVGIAAYETSKLAAANDAAAILAAQTAYAGTYTFATVHDKTDIGACSQSVYNAYYALYGTNSDINGIKNYIKSVATSFAAVVNTMAT